MWIRDFDDGNFVRVRFEQSNGLIGNHLYKHRHTQDASGSISIYLR